MFKKFTSENQNTYEYKAHKSFTLSQADVTRHQFLNNSSNEVSKSYYDFTRINFYLSGSTSDNYGSQFNIGNDGSGRDTFLTKFYDTGSIVFIPQNKFDEEIKRGSFVLTDTTTGARIVDDSNGNLYSTNAAHSQSVSALSSSDNYVGNIFYNVGVFSITETGSFNGISISPSGSNKDYTDVTSGNYTVSYQGTTVINTYEWTCDTQPNELNDTTNVTVFNSNGLGQLKDNLTSSNYPTYITEVGLYDDQNSLVGYAKLSKAIPKSQKLRMKFLLRMDY
tara:strand:- start:126 stop:962 length:837 start_codon:yes stop_codon:yes gene_type:complete